MRFVKGWLVVICFVASASSGMCSEPSEERRSPGYEESRLLYKQYVAELQCKQTFKGLPLYVVKVNSKGTGHLQANIAQADGFPRAKTQSTLTNQEGLFTDWMVRTSFLGDKGWTALSLDGAKELWGEPRRHTFDDQNFYTFDSHSFYGGEENIYHIDLRFGHGKLLEAYRVRGIGITNPLWVTKEDVVNESRQKSFSPYDGGYGSGPNYDGDKRGYVGDFWATKSIRTPIKK